MLHKVLFNYQFFCAPQLKQKLGNGDFPSFPVVKNLPYNAGDAGLIPGWGTKIPHAMWQLSPRTTTTELARLNERACVPQTTEPMHSGAHVPQLQSPRALEPAHHNQREKTRTPQPERSPCTSTKSPRTTTKDPACRS